MNKRLLSLDILRGADLFLLVVLCPVLLKLQAPLGSETYDMIMLQFTHKSWEGFALWDLVMPLFMFCSGVTIPFALQKYRINGVDKQFYFKLLRRFTLLWILGMVVQGNLLSLDLGMVKIYTNTLQAIAVGYVFAALIFVHSKQWMQYVIAGLLLVGYYIIMSVGGDFTSDGNFAEVIDRAVLGSLRDGAVVGQSGEVIFAPWYRYTWVLSSMTFIATCMSGVFAGQLLRNQELSGNRKALILFGAGTLMVALGWLWGMWMPVIKTIWSSSMVLVSSGYCFWAVALFYWLIDVRGYQRGVRWLQIFGMNSIVAYVLGESVNFRCIGHSIFYGLEQYIGSFYPFLIELSNGAVLFLILYILYRQKIFLKV